MNKIKIGKVYKTTSNNKTYYRIEVKIDTGITVIRKSFSRQKKYEVEEAAAEYIEKYKNININLAYNKDISVQEYFKTWIYVIKKPTVSNNTFEKYVVSYKNRLKDTQLGQSKLLEVTAPLIQDHLNNLSAVDTQTTLNAYFAHLKTFFKYCLGERIINYNPTINITIKAKKHQQNTEAYTVEEQKIILDNLDLENSVDLCIYLSLTTGLRLGECLALKWSDFVNDSIVVNKQFKRDVTIDTEGNKKRTYIESELKTKNSYRDVPLLPDTISILKAYRVHQARYILSQGTNYDNKNLIIADEFGNYIEKKRPTRRLKRLCKDACIEYKTFHALRHTYITRLFEADVNPKTVQKLVGHSDIQTTLNIYTHVSKREKENAVDKLNKSLKNVLV